MFSSFSSHTHDSVHFYPSFWTHQRPLWAIRIWSLMIPDPVFHPIPLREPSILRPPLYSQCWLFPFNPRTSVFLSIMRDYWYLLHLLSRQHIFFLHSYLFFIIIEWVNSIFKVHIPLSNISPFYFIYLFFWSPISEGLTITFFTVVKYQGHFLPRLPCFDIWHLTLSSCWSNWNPE